MTLDHEIGVQIPMPQQINVRVSELVRWLAATQSMQVRVLFRTLEKKMIFFP